MKYYVGLDVSLKEVSAEARELLTAVYVWFTEVFDTGIVGIH